MEAPSVTVRVQGKERTVRFDMGLLMAIEEQTEQPLGTVLDQFVGDGSSRKSRGRRFSMKILVGFVAACYGTSRDRLPELVSLDGLTDAARPLVPGFLEAVAQFNGAGTEENPPAAPQASAG